jgi:putative redox protein
VDEGSGQPTTTGLGQTGGQSGEPESGAAPGRAADESRDGGARDSRDSLNARDNLNAQDNLPPGTVLARLAGAGFRTEIQAGRHRIIADEPESVGGSDQGPNPYDYLLAALGACTVMTLRMYANLKEIPLEAVEVSLRHSKIHAEDCADCESSAGKIDLIERELRLEGPLDAAQRKRLMQIAERCPVHRTLASETKIRTRLLD